MFQFYMRTKKALVHSKRCKRKKFKSNSRSKINKTRKGGAALNRNASNEPPSKRGRPDKKSFIYMGHGYADIDIRYLKTGGGGGLVYAVVPNDCTLIRSTRVGNGVKDEIFETICSIAINDPNILNDPTTNRELIQDKMRQELRDDHHAHEIKIHVKKSGDTYTEDKCDFLSIFENVCDPHKAYITKSGLYPVNSGIYQIDDKKYSIKGLKYYMPDKKKAYRFNIDKRVGITRLQIIDIYGGSLFPRLVDIEKELIKLGYSLTRVPDDVDYIPFSIFEKVIEDIVGYNTTQDLMKKFKGNHYFILCRYADDLSKQSREKACANSNTEQGSNNEFVLPSRRGKNKFDIAFMMAYEMIYSIKQEYNNESWFETYKKEFISMCNLNEPYTVTDSAKIREMYRLLHTDRVIILNPDIEIMRALNSKLSKINLIDAFITIYGPLHEGSLYSDYEKAFMDKYHKDAPYIPDNTIKLREMYRLLHMDPTDPIVTYLTPNVIDSISNAVQYATFIETYIGTHGPLPEGYSYSDYERAFMTK